MKQSRKLWIFLGVMPLALAGPAALVYAHGGDTSLVHGCVNKVTKLARIVRANAACKRGETARHWSITGPPGPIGAAGPQGPAGSPDTPDQVRDKFYTGTACVGNDVADILVKAGALCVDAYEASVWSTPTGGAQFGATSDNYPCADNGNDCTGTKAIFARSVAGVTPSSNITWFQAQQACGNAGKRLLTNAEWQMAVAGTPDPGPDNGITDCNTGPPFAVTATGSRTACVSPDGAFDMVGNLLEWVADWIPRSTACGTWSTTVSPMATADSQCLAGAAITGEPGALVRGGVFSDGTLAGPLSVRGLDQPSHASVLFGFRCAR
ncbi:MAG: SUMF1/EgtB/PvdO family nonheme iron enzyme [Gammaproteobacteria bacterium]